MGNKECSLDDLVIHLGSSEEISRELRIEASDINPKHAKVTVIEQSSGVSTGGMTEICGCFIEFNGEVVANGCKEVGEWLSAYHKRRAAKIFASQCDSGEMVASAV